MAHAEGWIEAYEALEEGRSLSAGLLHTVRSNRNGLGETMLHWYAIEGAPVIVEKIIGLGFDVNTTNAFGRPPLFECVQINRWDMVELLLAHGARTDIRDRNGEYIFTHLKNARHHAKARKLADLIRRQRMKYPSSKSRTAGGFK
jgi:ankyrin repeat protein